MDDKNRIRTLVQNNQMSEAKSLCIEVCKKNPDDAEAWFLHGMLNGMLKNFTGADECYDNVIRLMPDMAAGYFNKGVALQALEKHKEALVAFNRVVALEPTFQNINLFLADVLSAMGKTESALEKYQTALDENPDDVYTYYKRGVLLLKQDKYQEAENCLKKAISLKNDYAEAYFMLASSLQRQNILEEAESVYKKVIEVRADYYLAYNNLGILYKDKEDIEEAAEYFKKAVHHKPDYTEALCNLGHSYQMLKKYRNALDTYQKATKLNPDNPEIHYNIGLQHENLGQYSKAILCYEQACLLDKKCIRYPFVLARVHAGDKNFNKAISIYKDVINKDPSFVDSYCNLGKIYLETGDKEFAIDVFRKAHEVSPDNITANYYLANLDGTFANGEASALYIEELFDNYANDFEGDLVESLQYKTPGEIHKDVMKFIDVSRKYSIFDLGCGTGLCGELFRDSASRLVGVDLSSRIIEKAHEKSIYDELYTGEITVVLNKQDDYADLILAADVFVYIGDLMPVFEASKQTLKSGGLFSFSVEHKDGESYLLQSSGRYSHSVDYIEKLATKIGFQILSHTTSVIRKEFGADVQGDIFVLENSRRANQ